MNGEEPVPAKIQKMLEGLALPERQALELAIEKAREQGKVNSIYAMLEAQSKTAERQPLHLPDISALFFKPLDKFLIADKPPSKINGRVWQEALQVCWSWIAHDLAPKSVNDCRQRLQDLNGRIFSIDDPALIAIENDLRKAVLPPLEEALDRARQTPETRRRFAAQFGGHDQVQEMEDINVLLKYKDVIETCDQCLPSTLSHTVPAHVAAVKKLLGKLVQMDKRLTYYAAVLIQRRLHQSAQLPLWATACAGSDDLRQIENSPFAAMIELSLGDVARMSALCISDLAKPPEQSRAGSFVRTYAVLCRNLRAAIDFDAQTSDWLRRLSEIRQHLSGALAQQFSEMFQLMRQNVRPLRAFGAQTPQLPDEFDIERLCFLIAMLGTVRTNVQEFVLNELVGRIYNECDGYLMLAVDSLQQELRAKPGDKRRFILAYADAAVRVSRAWYGDDYAAVLKRAFETAANAAAKPIEDKASA